MNLKKITATAATALALSAAGLGATTAQAAYVDSDTAVMQTSGGYAKVVTNWTNYYGNGNFTFTITAASGKCSTLVERDTYENGTQSAWTTIGTVCGGSRTMGPYTNRPSGDIAKSTFKLTTGSSVDTYSISPGGA